MSSETLSEGASNLDYNVTFNLDNPLNEDSVINITTTDISTSGNQDYILNQSQITIKRGETSKTIRVTIVGNVVAEPLEEFELEFSAAANITLPDNLKLEITDDDPYLVTVDSLSLIHI